MIITFSWLHFFLELCQHFFEIHVFFSIATKIIFKSAYLSVVNFDTMINFSIFLRRHLNLIGKLGTILNMFDPIFLLTHNLVQIYFISLFLFGLYIGFFCRCRSCCFSGCLKLAELTMFIPLDTDPELLWPHLRRPLLQCKVQQFL